jgi:hypothetical protein
VADEDLAATKAGEAGEITPAEKGAEALEPQITEEQEPEAVVTLASELGWKPKDQFRGDPDDWRPAADFIRASRDINQSLSRELRGVRDQVTRMERVSSELLRDKLAERDAYWASQQAKAVEDGDSAAVDRIVSKRIELRQSAPVADDTPPETVDFMERNKAWFGKDRLATLRAREVCGQLAKEGVSPAEQLRDAERAVRKEFPELFPAPAKQAPGVQTATSRNATPANRRKGFADMPAESQQMAVQYQKDHGIPKEKFAESYWADVEKNRRVG